jgi:hypothetical protein
MAVFAVTDLWESLARPHHQLSNPMTTGLIESLASVADLVRQWHGRFRRARSAGAVTTLVSFGPETDYTSPVRGLHAESRKENG